jgi:signal transduction histidine kinase/streptogramin lyase
VARERRSSGAGPDLGIPHSIRTLYRDSEGSLVIGATNEGLYRLSGEVLHRYRHEALEHATVMAIVEDRKGNLWVGTDGDGLFVIDGGDVVQLTQQDGLLSHNVLALSLDQEGNLIIGTNKGLQVRNNDSFDVFEEVGPLQINALWVDHWNAIWFGTERGLGRVSRRFKTMELLTSKNNTDFVRITSILPDREGNVWLTSNRSGLIRLKETSISNISKPEVTSNRVNIVHEAPDGTLYIGTDLNVINKCRDRNCSSITVNSLQDGNGIRDVFVEDANSIWLATYSGIIHLDHGKERVYNVAWGMPAEDFRTILKDNQGNFWFGSRSGGLVKFRDGKIIKIFDRDHGLRSNYILAVTEGQDESIYVGTHSGGMSVIAPNDQTVTYHLRDDDSGILLFNIDVDSQGRVWVMANIGPAYFSGDSLQALALRPDEHSKTFFDWIDDERENVLITTNIGILQLSKQSIDAFIKGEITNIPFNLLDDADGMNNKECTGATRSLKARTGNVYIPTLGGVCVIDPNRQKKNTTIPAVRIAHFQTDRKEENLHEPGTTVEAGTLRYSFRFSVLSYTTPGRNLFRYKLEGFDKEWSAAVPDNEVEYTNLPPGKYTFRVIGCNDNNVWNEEGASFAFAVNPFFYQTFWFYAVILVVISTLLFLLYKWRISFVKRQNEALRKVNAELDRFVYSASHDLRSPLASILGLINVAREDDEWDKHEYLSLIEKSVKKLDSFIGDIIDFSRNARLEIVPEKIDFETSIRDILDDLRYIDNFDRISKSISVESNADFYTDSKRLRMILSNVIANAIKHHLPSTDRENYISIRVQSEKNNATIFVQDDGPGIKKEHQENIFKMFFRASSRTSGSGLGLYIVQETVDKLGGKISVTSSQGNGTTFSISLPNLVNNPMANPVNIGSVQRI